MAVTRVKVKGISIIKIHCLGNMSVLINHVVNLLQEKFHLLVYVLIINLSWKPFIQSPKHKKVLSLTFLAEVAFTTERPLHAGQACNRMGHEAIRPLAGSRGLTTLLYASVSKYDYRSDHSPHTLKWMICNGTLCVCSEAHSQTASYSELRLCGYLLLPNVKTFQGQYLVTSTMMDKDAQWMSGSSESCKPLQTGTFCMGIAVVCAKCLGNPSSPRWDSGAHWWTHWQAGIATSHGLKGRISNTICLNEMT